MREVRYLKGRGLLRRPRYPAADRMKQFTVEWSDDGVEWTTFESDDYHQADFSNHRFVSVRYNYAIPLEAFQRIREAGK